MNRRRYKCITTSQGRHTINKVTRKISEVMENEHECRERMRTERG